MVTLTKGQTVSLAKANGGKLTQATMGVGWDVRKAGGLRSLFGGGGGDIDLDASCLLFDSGGRQVDQAWFRQLKSKDGSIVHTGDNRTGAGDGDDEQIKVDLNRVPANVTTLLFTVNSFTGDTFDKIQNAYCRLVDATSDKELARYDLSGSGPHTGQIMARLTRTATGWDMKAIGEKTSGRTFHDMAPAIRSSL